MTRIFAKSDVCLLNARHVFGETQEDGAKTGAGVAHNGVPEQLPGNFGEQSNARRPDWCANGRPWDEPFRISWLNSALPDVRRKDVKGYTALSGKAGTPGRTRTGTSKKLDFESSASTNSATGALCG